MTSVDIQALSTTNIADALDACQLKGATFGIRPIWEHGKKIAGRAITVKMTAAGETKNPRHLGVDAITSANPGDIVVVDNGGRLDTSCWGGVLATGASLKGIAGVVVDGAVRDVDDYVDLGFPVFARGAVTATARGRIMEESTNSLIQFAGTQVRPGDFVMADRSGVVIVPSEHYERVMLKAQDLYVREEGMIADLKGGLSMQQVDKKYGYENMLK